MTVAPIGQSFVEALDAQDKTYSFDVCDNPPNVELQSEQIHTQAWILSIAGGRVCGITLQRSSSSNHQGIETQNGSLKAQRIWTS